MTIIAAAYDGPNSYALAADSHGIFSGIRIPSVKTCRAGAVLFGHAGSSAEGRAGGGWLMDGGLEWAQSDLPMALAAMRVHILANTERAKDCPGLDSHYLAVGPSGIWMMGSDGGISRTPNRWAIGCGEDVGLGAMFAAGGGEPWDVVDVAVRAACALREGCFGVPIILRGPG